MLKASTIIHMDLESHYGKWVIGLTPMLQIIKAILRNPLDFTEIHLLYANVNYEDILLKDELDQLVNSHPRFTVYYVLNNVSLVLIWFWITYYSCIPYTHLYSLHLSKPPSNWNGGVGFISKEMIQDACPAPASDIKILICGPPPMVCRCIWHFLITRIHLWCKIR